MNKKDLKYFLILFLSLLVTEILNEIVFLISYFSVDKLVNKAILPKMSMENIDIICRILVAIFAIIQYLFISKKVFCKHSDEKMKRNVLIILAVIIVVSYPLSARFAISSGLFYSTHWSMCSPIAYVLLLPLMNKGLPILYGILSTILSPISVLLIWLFSKIKIKNTRDDSVC